MAAALMVFAACEEEPLVGPHPADTVPTDNIDSTATGRVLVLNEGTWGANNASISLINNTNGAIVADWFTAQNGRGLGDLAQDLITYGSKVYATVSESGSLEVIDRTTGRSERVDLGTRYPRYMAAHEGKIYISCYNPHCVIRIDTASLAIEATCTLGGYNPEGVAVAGGKLFVASSNVSDQQGTYSYDNQLYVVDLTTFANPTTIVVGRNPQRVQALDANRVVVNYWGNYGSETGGAAVVDATTLEVSQTGVALNGMTVAEGNIYGYVTTYSADYSTKSTRFVRIDGNTLASSDIMENCGIENAYGIGVDPSNGDLYVTTDGDYHAAGDVHCLTATGALRWTLRAGWFPSKVIFL